MLCGETLLQRRGAEGFELPEVILTAPARASGGAGFKGQRPLRTVSPPFEIQLRLFVVARPLVVFSLP